MLNPFIDRKTFEAVSWGEALSIIWPQSLHLQLAEVRYLMAQGEGIVITRARGHDDEVTVGRVLKLTRCGGVRERASREERKNSGYGLGTSRCVERSGHCSVLQ